jgi:hypothetical protein
MIVILPLLAVQQMEMTLHAFHQYIFTSLAPPCLRGGFMISNAAFAKGLII